VRIGIDISQIAYENTGVANFTTKLVLGLLTIDQKNEYVFFFSSLRRKLNPDIISRLKVYKNLTIKFYSLPPSLLDIFWNRLHILPIERFIGDIDIFISSDWTQPPAKKAKMMTILYDVIVYAYPNETDQSIVATQKRRLKWVKQECEAVICISKASKNDAIKYLGIPDNKLYVVYPGVT